MLAIGPRLMLRPGSCFWTSRPWSLAPLLGPIFLKRIRSIAADGTAVLLAEQNVGGALGAADHGYVMQTAR